MQTRKTRTFTYHEDPGHGWIEVPMQELYALGIAAKSRHTHTAMARPPFWKKTMMPILCSKPCERRALK